MTFLTAYLMPIDAGFLFVWSVCALIIASEDGSFTPISRIPIVMISGFAFWYCGWLLSEWSPGPAGFPWQRTVLDGLIAFAAIWRSVVVLRALRRNTGRLFAIMSFGRPLKQ